MLTPPGHLSTWDTVLKRHDTFRAMDGKMSEKKKHMKVHISNSNALVVFRCKSCIFDNMTEKWEKLL